MMIQTYLYFVGIISCQVRGKRFDAQLSGNEDEEGKTVSQAVIAAVRKKNELLIPFADLPISKDAAKLLYDALGACFQVMQLRLQEEDDPQIIFETLNARGAPLTPSDLIRNFVFLRAARNEEDVDALYNEHWRAFDEKPDETGGAKGAKFWRKEERQGRLKSSRLDLFMFYYTTLRRGVDTIKVGHVFEEFKDWWDEEPRDTNTELALMATMAKHFEKFVAPDQKPNSDGLQTLEIARHLDGNAIAVLPTRTSLAELIGVFADHKRRRFLSRAQVCLRLYDEVLQQDVPQ